LGNVPDTEFGNEFNVGSSQGEHPGYHHEEDSSNSSDSDYEEDMPVDGKSDIEDINPHEMGSNNDDEFFEEDAPILDDESGYIYSAKRIYPPMEIDSDLDDYDDDDDDFVYRKLISCQIGWLFTYSSHTQMIILGIFLKRLDMSEVALAFRDFSLGKNKNLNSSTALVHGGLTPLDNSLTTILQHPTSIEAALAIPQMWRNINNITDDIERNHLESCILQACIMWAALSLNQWVENTIVRVQSGKANKSWVNKLLTHIENVLNLKGPWGSEVILRSEDFLARLPHHTYKCAKPRFTYNTEVVKEKTRQIAHDAIREWLRFPSDKTTMIQCAFLQTLVSRTHISVLLLDVVWIAYRDPFKLVFNSFAGQHIS
jgi:hypothetical protein